MPHINSDMLRFVLQLLFCWYLLINNNCWGTTQGDDLPHWTGLRNTHKTVHTHVFRDSIPLLSTRIDLIKGRSVSHDYIHEVIFSIRQKNMDELVRILHDISDPVSANYGQHWTRERVANLTANLEARDAVVTYLEDKGAVIVSETLSGEYVKANASISVWETMFNTKFFTFSQTHRDSRVNKMIRAETYSVPRELDLHIESVFNTVEAPILLFNRTIQLIPINIITPQTDMIAGTITPAKIRAVYNMNINVQGSALSTQAAFGGANQYFDPADLAYFQSQFGMTPNLVTSSIGGHSSSTQCLSAPFDCVEANLDIQYLMSTSRESPTTYWYTDSLFADWLVAVASTVSPPLVLSISYGLDEKYASLSELNAFNTQAIKLGVMGVTILAASGDDGSNSNGVCGYAIMYPASSPYVTAVGATAGPESGTPEVVCQIGLNSVITSGGGFSRYYARPAFQSAAVANYFVTAANAGQSPVSGYNSGGRAYPDVSLAGNRYVVSIGGVNYIVAGTSASAPVVGGFFSNINAIRIAAGKGSLGWVNPTLYKYYTQFTNDITSGNTLCPRGVPSCCATGFYATTDWDPATGLGSLDYSKLEAVLTTLGDVTAFAPSVSPTTSPIIPPSRTPTTAPIKAPTVVPSLAPNAVPTTAPDRTPTTETFTSPPTSNLSITAPSDTPAAAPTDARNASLPPPQDPIRIDPTAPVTTQDPPATNAPSDRSSENDAPGRGSSSAPIDLTIEIVVSVLCGDMTHQLHVDISSLIKDVRKRC